MKSAVATLLRKTRRKRSVPAATSTRRSTMNHALKWLGEQEFDVQTVLDVGASNGCWSQACMNSFPDADYLLFEPQPVHSDALDEFAASCKQQVVPIKKAVGANEGVTHFDVTDPFGGALARGQRVNTIEVELTTIDATVANYKSESPFLLKLDTHGFEKSILEGATETLKQCSALIIEAYNYRISDEAMLFWELCAYLAERGFRPVDMVDVLHRQHDASLWQVDIVFARSTWEGFKCNFY